MLFWPANLKCITQENLSVSRGETRWLSSTDSTVTLMSQKTSRATDVMPVQMEATIAEWSQFDYFHRVTTKKGLIEFMMPDPFMTNLPILDENFQTILTVDGLPLWQTNWLLARFGKTTPTYNPKDRLRMINFDIWIYP